MSQQYYNFIDEKFRAKIEVITFKIILLKD